MSRRDIYNELKDTAVTPPVAAVTGSSPYESASVDMSCYYAVMFTGSLGVGGVGTMKIQESDDDSVWTDAVAADVQGTQDAALVASGTLKLGYIGVKRYVRVSTTITTDGPLSVTAVQGKPRTSPVA